MGVGVGFGGCVGIWSDMLILLPGMRRASLQCKVGLLAVTAVANRSRPSKLAQF